MRAQVCRDACKMVSQVATELGDDAKGLVSASLPALLKSVTNSKKVIVNFADTAIMGLLNSCDASILMGEIVCAATDKNAALRERSCFYLETCLNKYDADALEQPKMMLDEILRVVKTCLADSKGEVRNAAFACLLIIETKFPTMHTSLVESLDTTASKQLAALKAKQRS